MLFSQGIDSPEPLLQLDQYLFKGSYEDIIGTSMVFEQVKGKLDLVVGVQALSTCRKKVELRLQNKQEIDHE